MRGSRALLEDGSGDLSAEGTGAVAPQAFRQALPAQSAISAEDQAAIHGRAAAFGVPGI